jgi:hypothetical protein
LGLTEEQRGGIVAAWQDPFVSNGRVQDNEVVCKDLWLGEAAAVIFHLGQGLPDSEGAKLKSELE